jgi:predicted anti-sigma-YlaC factor YlaD
MKCSEVRKLLSAYLDAEVSEKDSRFIEEHIASCAACKTELDELSSVTRVIDSIEDIKVNPYFSIRLKRVIGDTETKQVIPAPILDWIRRAVVPVGAIALLLVSLFTGQQLGKVLYQIDAARTKSEDREVEYLMGVSSLNDVPQGVFSETFNTFITGGSQ